MPEFGESRQFCEFSSRAHLESLALATDLQLLPLSLRGGGPARGQEPWAGAKGGGEVVQGEAGET